MRYAIFTDIHANLEALEAVLAKIDELAQEKPVEQVWFLGDLVGYGPNPNECIVKLRERTDTIIAGNHDWAAVGKIDLEDFSEAARVSAEWTATQLTEEHRTFLADLPERIEKGDFLLVHGSPYGPLWEYLTSEVLAERSFQQFTNRYCLVGHTHVPVIFLQPDTVANAPTRPLEADEALELLENSPLKATIETDAQIQDEADTEDDEDDETESMFTVRPAKRVGKGIEQVDNAHIDTQDIQTFIVDTTDAITELQQQLADDAPEDVLAAPSDSKASSLSATVSDEEVLAESDDHSKAAQREDIVEMQSDEQEEDEKAAVEEITPEETIQSAEERLNQEIEELLTLLGLSQSMIEVTNEMLVPPEGTWQTNEGYRAIINPGGVGQPRDGDPRAAFMIYDTEDGSFTFYRVPYAFEKTQKKIVEVGLPHYLATRLAYGR
ncbi:MAG: metallophosphoesterase family protein [Ktedonobacteraceae bacterium]|nr:metallophosphoesterase family protein [Ktedonobacteraceae bacterium]